jgi:protocatechuate 3,4-dioxygenase beta subunit
VDLDDLPRGRLLTRREALALMTAAAAGMLVGSSEALAAAHAKPPLSGCVVRPEQTEGPYFVDEMLHRSDIRSDPTDGSVRTGVPLRLAFAVKRIHERGCAPLAGAVVDVWHCDADGIYSDVRDPGFDTTGRKFLRGYQTTDARGMARFTTIYPGWYQGRTVHIHFKVRSSPTANPGFEFTSQLYFDDRLTDRVFAQPPYARRGRRTVRNDRDGIYRNGGSQLLLAVTRDPSGYTAPFDIALHTA